MVKLQRLHGLNRRQKRAIVLAAALLALPLALWLAMSLQGGALRPILAASVAYGAVVVVATVYLAARLGLYRAVMRYVGEQAFLQILKAVTASAALVGLIAALVPAAGWTLSGAVIYWLLALTFVGGSRWVARWLLYDQATLRSGERVAIYGAGQTGRQLNYLLSTGTEYCPAFFIDDAPELQGAQVNGLRIYAGSDDLENLVTRYGVREIFLAMPSASARRRREILLSLEHLPVHVRSVPDLGELVTGVARIDQLRDIRVEELLGREPVPPIENLLHQPITGKTVLITGAGGSIGSELARQALALQPRNLILLDIAEYSLYKLEQELIQAQPSKAPNAQLVFLLGSVMDQNRLAQLFATWKVDTVFHAAAYKHVPLVEHNPYAGLGNNVLGTVRTAEAAIRGGVGRFVLISTDKAVRPTNVMGASKRLAEMFVQAMAARDDVKTVFGMVRFGNVLGSSGSVVPRFAAQIKAGGPVTVTHPEVTRYFMTIPEAVQLVIQAGAMARGGEVFVLDMGESVKIVDLARKMIRLSGRSVREPGSESGDIEIRITGLRPGEKLYEELLIGDAVGETLHPRILRADEVFLTWEELQPCLQAIVEGQFQAGDASVRELLHRWVDGYRRPVTEVKAAAG